MILLDLIGVKKISFQYPKSQPDYTGGRPDGRPAQWSVDHHGRPMCTRRAQRPSDLAGRPCGRPTEVTPLSGGGRSTGRSTVGFGPVDRRHNGHKNDRRPVDRTVDRKGNSALSRLPTGRIFEGYKYAFSWVILDKFFNPYRNPADCTGGRSDGRPAQWSVDRHSRPLYKSRAQRLAYSAGRPHGRPTDSTSLSGGGRSIGRSTDGFGPVDRAVDRRNNGHKNDLKRAVDQKGSFALPDCQRAEFWEGINTHLLSWFLYGFWEQNFPIFLSVLVTSLKEFFCAKRFILYLF